MELHLRSKEEWLRERRTSAVMVSALVGSMLFSSMSTAGELGELSVKEVDGEFTIRIVAVLDAPTPYVYEVITDYKHAYRIDPSIIEVEVLPTDRDEVIRVRNLSEHWVGPFCFKTHWVGDIMETTKGDLKVETIPELSSYESGSAIWKFLPWGENRTWVLHESTLKPRFYIPPIIGDYIIKKRIEGATLAIFNKIECHAKIMFEMDMENEPELLKSLLKGDEECTTS